MYRYFHARKGHRQNNLSDYMIYLGNDGREDLFYSPLGQHGAGDLETVMLMADEITREEYERATAPLYTPEEYLTPSYA